MVIRVTFDPKEAAALVVSWVTLGLAAMGLIGTGLIIVGVFA